MKSICAFNDFTTLSCGTLILLGRRIFGCLIKSFIFSGSCFEFLLLNEIIHDAFEEFRSIEDVGHVVVQYVEFGRDPLPLLELFW
eukprot:jgi/Pico_ML_1/52362/g3074.t1